MKTRGSPQCNIQILKVTRQWRVSREKRYGNCTGVIFGLITSVGPDVKQRLIGK